MWNRLSVKNFQSLKEIDLNFGAFTVILGASSSGKSAIVRSLRTLVSNARGSSFTTRGEKTTVIALDSELLTVRLERSGSAGSYTLIDNGAEAVFTKLGGATPAAISERLRVPPVDSAGSLHFAEQFDRPFLLDESGATVARVLGELTNVNLIFEASREANRRRLSLSKDLAFRKKDLSDLVEKASSFRKLPSQLQSCAKAEDALAQAQNITEAVRILRESISDVEIASRELAKVEVPKAVKIDHIESEHSKLVEFKTLVVEWRRAEQEVVSANEKEKASCLEVTRLQEELKSVLDKAGICPTCNREI